MLVARLETLAETILFRSPGDCSVLVQNLRLHLVGNGFIRSAFLETHYCTYGYVFCGSPVRNNGGNRGVSRPGRLCYISAKSTPAPCREQVCLFRFSAPLSTHSAAAADEEQDKHQQQKHRDRADYDRCELLLTAQLLRPNGLRLGLFKPCLALRNERHRSVDRAVTGV